MCSRCGRAHGPTGGALHNAVAQLTPALVVQCAGDLDVALAALYLRAIAQDARRRRRFLAARCGEAAHAHSDVRHRAICVACGCACGRRGRPGAGRGGRQRRQRHRAPLSTLLTRPASLSGSGAQQSACYAYTMRHANAHPSFRGAKSPRQSPQDVSGSGSRRVRDRIAPLTSQAFRRRSSVAVGGALSTGGHKVARLATQAAAPWHTSGGPHRQRVDLARHRFRTSALDPAALRCPLARTWKRGKPVVITTSHVTAATHATQRKTEPCASAHTRTARPKPLFSRQKLVRRRARQHTCQSSRQRARGRARHHSRRTRLMVLDTLGGAATPPAGAAHGRFRSGAPQRAHRLMTMPETA